MTKPQWQSPALIFLLGVCLGSLTTFAQNVWNNDSNTHNYFLPVELWNSICSAIDDEQDRNRFGHVCRTFKTILSENNLADLAIQ